MDPFYIVPSEKYEYIVPDFVEIKPKENGFTPARTFVPMSSFWHI